MGKGLLAFFVGVLLVVFSVMFSHSNKVDKRKVISNDAQAIKIDRDEAPLVQQLKARNYLGIAEEFRRAREPQNEEVLSQLIYYFDFYQPPADEKLEILKQVMLVYSERSNVTPRGLVLLSRLFGKYSPKDSQEQKMLTDFYKAKFPKGNPALFIEATVRWVPLPELSKDSLIQMKKSKRNDLVLDFQYFVDRIKDQKALSQLNEI